MKGVYGLVIAIGLGIVGAMFNLAYLAKKASDLEVVKFITVAKDVVLEPGDKLKQEHLGYLCVPKNAAGEFRKYYYLYDEERQSVLDLPVNRHLSQYSPLLREDMRPLPPWLNLAPDKNKDPTTGERSLGIPVDTSTGFVPALVGPGDMVSFLIPKNLGVPTPAGAPAVRKAGLAPVADSGESSDAAVAAATDEMVGPFKILSMGNRTGTTEQMKSGKRRQVQENVMQIGVLMDHGQLEPRAQKLLNALRAIKFKGMVVLIHPRSQPK